MEHLRQILVAHPRKALWVKDSTNDFLFNFIGFSQKIGGNIGSLPHTRNLGSFIALVDFFTAYLPITSTEDHNRVHNWP